MNTLTLWIIVIVSGVLTFGIRLSFIALVGDRALPALARRTLRFVPVAVLSAIIVPELVVRQGTVNLAPTNPRLLVGVIAILIAWRTKNALLTIAVGMVALWILQAILPTR